MLSRLGNLFAGPAPFPTHTVTEDFALGMRLRAHNPRFSGIYLPLQLVKGTAPDTIRAAFKQRSRWTKACLIPIWSSHNMVKAFLHEEIWNLE